MTPLELAKKKKKRKKKEKGNQKCKICGEKT